MPSIRRTMGLVALVGVILGLLLATRRADSTGFVAVCILAALVVVVPAHLAIEANRRESGGPG